MKNGTIYRCDLLSVVPNIRVCKDDSKSNNIQRYATYHRDAMEKKETILVQKTLNPKYFREILTGKLIPVMTKRKDYWQNTEFYSKMTSPCFILLEKDYYNYKFSRDNLAKAYPFEVEEYIKKHIEDEEYNTFLNRLNSIFDEAENIYSASEKKGYISGQKQIKKVKKMIRK